jgi:RNA polymerase sigma-70 factor, ECF subfamily
VKGVLAVLVKKIIHCNRGKLLFGCYANKVVLTATVYIERFDHPCSMEIPDKGLVHLLSQRDEKAFEQVFKQHFKPLHAYAFTLLKDDAAAEEVVQNVFYKLWERTEGLTISGPLGAYLYRAVHNESLNYLKYRKVRAEHSLRVSYHMDGRGESATRTLQEKELEEKVRTALNELPEGCRTVFQLSRFEEMKYSQIADVLGISIKTVENQMGKALKLLRTRLMEFLTLAVLFVNFLNRHL